MTLVWSGLAVGAIYALVTVARRLHLFGHLQLRQRRPHHAGHLHDLWGTGDHLEPFVAVLLAGAVVGATAFVQERVRT